MLFNAAMAVAGAAWVGDHLGVAVAARAGLLHREEALLHTHLTYTTTGGTGNRAGALLRARAIASFAIDQGWHANSYGGAAHRLFQIEFQGVTQVTATLGTAA